MKKLLTFNIWTVSFAVLFYLVSYLLLRDNFHLSISTIFDHSHSLEKKEHLLVLGLIPIYIATIIFGTTLIGIYFATMIQQLFVKLFLRKKKLLRNTP